MTASFTVSAFRRVTRKSAIAPSTANSTSASTGDTRRAASGRSRVRRTCGSMSRSAKSLMTQPAARITMTPSRNTMSTRGSGRPAPATHSAHRAGHSSSQVPIGLSSRMRRAYSLARRARRCDSGASGDEGAAANSGETAAMGGTLAYVPAATVAAGVTRGCRRGPREITHLVWRVAFVACGKRDFVGWESADAAVTLAGADPACGERRDPLGMPREQPLGALLYAGQKIGIAHEIRDAQLCESGLACAEELARASQLEIAPRDLETIGA